MSGPGRSDCLHCRWVVGAKVSMVSSLVGFDCLHCRWVVGTMVFMVSGHGVLYFRFWLFTFGFLVFILFFGVYFVFLFSLLVSWLPRFCFWVSPLFFVGLHCFFVGFAFRFLLSTVCWFVVLYDMVRYNSILNMNSHH